MCMKAPYTPPKSTVPTKNPPILALYLGIFNGPLRKNKNRHWSFETTQLSIFSTPNRNLSSNLLCFEGLQRQQGVWCDVDEGIASSISQGEIPNCGILDGFFDHIGFWLSPGVLGNVEKRRVYPTRKIVRVWEYDQWLSLNFERFSAEKNLKFTWNIPNMCFAHANLLSSVSLGRLGPLIKALMSNNLSIGSEAGGIKCLSINAAWNSGFHGGNLPWVSFLSGVCEHLLCVSAQMMTWSWREWFG